MKTLVTYFKGLQSPFIKMKYLQGYPNVDFPFDFIVEPNPEGLDFMDTSSYPPKKKFFIKKEDIINISVEDQSTIENRVGFARMMMVGIFALAWKKRSKVPLSFLIIEYRNEFGDTQEVYFQSEQNNGFQEFTNLKYNIKKYWKEAEENPNFLEQWKEEEEIYQEKRSKEQLVMSMILIIIIIVAFMIYLAI